MVTPEARALLEPAATKVRDPVSGRSAWLAGLVTEGRLQDGMLLVGLTFGPQHTPDDRVRIQEALRANLHGAGFTGEIVCNVRLAGRSPSGARPPAEEPGGARAAAGRPAAEPVRGMSGPGVQPHGGPIQKQPVPGVRHVVAVASGKGGVGKSTVAVNLACALAERGHLVGLMDADIYGPSLPLMMNVGGRLVADAERRILPLQAYGVKCMSIGFLVDDAEPIIWRGPMVMGVVRQFLQEVAWAPLDVLVVDLPPGTGDAQLTMIQATPISGAIVVTTPQELALIDARRGVEMFRKLDVPVLGVVENMSWLELPDGSRVHPFGEGGGGRMAARFEVPLLGQVPLDPRIREGGDQGAPAALSEGPGSEVFDRIAGVVAERLGM